MNAPAWLKKYPECFVRLSVDSLVRILVGMLQSLDGEIVLANHFIAVLPYTFAISYCGPNAM